MEGGEWPADSKTPFHFLLSTFEEMTGGGKHEEAKENQSFEGSLKTEKC
jgi:hypothetical protein